jgi:hypothetical protein
VWGSWTIYSATQHKRTCITSSCAQEAFGNHVYSGGKCTSCGKPQ